MIKNLIKGFAVVAFAAMLVAAPLSGRASASHGPTKLQDCSWHYPTLRPGANNDCVRMVQELMNVAKVIYGQGGTLWPTVNPIDGRYGSQTRAAVFSFQRYHQARRYPGMSTDGIVGPQTWMVLGAECMYEWPRKGFYSFHCSNF